MIPRTSLTILLEIARSKLLNLGITYPGSITATASSLGATGVGAASGLVLSDLGHQNSNTIGVSPVSVTLNALQTAGNTNTLANNYITGGNNIIGPLISQYGTITNYNPWANFSY